MTTPGSEPNSTGNQNAFFQLSYSSFISINGPLIILNLTANLFFVFCLMTRKTQQVKQPLKILLGSMVSYAILYLLSVLLMSFLHSSLAVVWICYFIMEFIILVNMTSYVWLMFYYYIMIVPSQRALLVWVKKNIKSVIYIMLFFERLLFLGYDSCQLTILTNLDNFTYPSQSMFVLSFTSLSIVHLYIFLCLCLMMFCSFATAHYLNKHMKSLAASGGSPRLRSHIRVTVTGILQGVLYFLYITWNLVYVMSIRFAPSFYIDLSISYTATCLYISGTTANLGVGQTVFRERAVHVWKAVRKRLSMGKSSKNPKPPRNQLIMTSLAVIESSAADTGMSL